MKSIVLEAVAWLYNAALLCVPLALAAYVLDRLAPVDKPIPDHFYRPGDDFRAAGRRRDRRAWLYAALVFLISFSIMMFLSVNSHDIIRRAARQLAVD